MAGPVKVPILKIPFTDEDVRFVADGVGEVLRSGMLVMASKTREFEARFADFLGSPQAVAVNSGTSALEIIFRCLGVAGGSVVVPSNTFMATAMAAVKAGARVVFGDCRRDDLQMDPDDLKRTIRDDTRAVALVHVGGVISPHFSKIREICADRGVPLIEDAAHAHGAALDGHSAGTLARAAAFSFFPTKVLTTAEGGMITTGDADLAAKARVLRDHGKEAGGSGRHVEIGDNWRFSEIHALLGLCQMNKADWILAERRRIAAAYDRLLPGVPGLRPLRIPENVQSSYYKYIVFLDEALDRAALKKKMKEDFGVALTGEVYADPCHLQPVVADHPECFEAAELPNTEWVSRRHACLPLYPGLTDGDVEYVVESLKMAVVGL